MATSCSTNGFRRRWLVLLPLWLALSSARADNFSVVLQGTNGNRIPRVIGASGSIQSAKGFTGFDYFEWFGITHHRYWFKPSFSPLNPTGGVTDVASFNAATAAVRADPWRQGTSSDVYFDWARFQGEFDSGGGSQNVTSGSYALQRLGQLGIVPMMVNTVMTDQDPLADWGNKFMYWKFWYAYVYFFASQYGLTMYELSNEPNANPTLYSKWESHWLICADAMRKAIADVNANYGKNLTFDLCGPTTAGPYWDYSLPNPTNDMHGWGSVSWRKVQTDIYGNIDPSIWNYGMYDYHRYSTGGAVNESTYVAAVRQDIANAANSPNSTIPLLMTEYNTSTGGNFTSKGLDTEDLTYGIATAQILQSTATLGPAGLGDRGGFFLFKLGAPGVTSVTCGIGNQTAYVSALGDYNYGGVTRGGACFQLYARHFRGGKPVLGYTVTAGASSLRRLAAVWDQDRGAYYVYFSNVNGTSSTTSLDLGALDVQLGAPVTVARVDAKNTGQITDYLSVDAGKKVTFSAPNNTAFLVWIPQNNSAGALLLQRPTNDTYLVVGEGVTNRSAEPTLKVSLHHSIATERRVGFLQFDLGSLAQGNRYLLKLSGHNIGTSPTTREIVHVYGAGSGIWSETDLTWATAPGVGRYYTSTNTMAPTTGLGSMVDIEDNYGGVTSGAGQGLGLYGKFLGPMSFSSSSWATNYVDVTDYVKSLIVSNQTLATFVLARIVRYNVNQFSNSTYYAQGVYDCDGRIVEIGAKENPNLNYQPGLVVWAQQATAAGTDIVWNGTTDHFWGTDVNWTNSNIPDTTGENAMFNTTASNALITNTINGTAYPMARVSIGGSSFNIGQLRFAGQPSGASGWEIYTGSTGGPYTLTVHGNSGNNPVIISSCTAANINSGQGHDLKLALGLNGDNEVQVNGAVLQVQANIINGSGVTAGLTKTGPGMLVLTSAESHTGNTTISAGVLQLARAGSISNSPIMSIAAGATLDVSGIAAYNLSASTTLSASGAGTTVGVNAAEIKGGATVALGTQPVTLNYDGVDPALYISQGTLSLSGNHFTVNTATPLAAGAYTLVQQASGNISTSGSNTVTGTAIGSGYTGVISVSGGNVILTTVNASTKAWSATPANYQWDATSANWTGAAGIFSNGDPVQFTDTGSASAPIVLVGALSPASVMVDVSTNHYLFSGIGYLSGTNSLIKNGSSTLTLSNLTANNYSGGTFINGGTLEVATTNSFNLANPSPITIASNATLLVLRDPNATGALHWYNDVSGAGRWQVGTGTGSATTELDGDYNAFTGTLEVATGGAKIAFSSAAKFPSASATLQLDANLTAYINVGGTFSSAIQMYGGMTGEALGQLRLYNGVTASGPITLFADTTIGVDGGRSATLSGNIGGSFGFTKLSLGTLTLSGKNTYAGNTVIKAGTLALGAAGSISNSLALSIAAGATFDVSAITACNLSSNTALSATGAATAAAIKGAAGGSVNLGSQPITLTYDGSHPALSVSQGTLSLNGNAFTVNSSSALANGTYTIIQQASGSIASSGTYPAVTGTAIDASHAGSIFVIGNAVNLVVQNATAAYPTNISSSASGNRLSLSWPWTHLGWILQGQTNGLAGLGSNWADVPGTAAATSTNIAINPANPSVFFRLRHP